MLTFTGERVIPGAVEPDLWNEHVSRYYFACEFAPNQSLLDIGCGAGYGTDLVAARAKRSLGIDISPETVHYAASHAENNVQFCVASAESIPVPDQSFGLITAFEVIEHLSGWSALISEAARILTANGVFLVSTPNKVYYAETRQNAGSNPFHVHEFELAEFRDALKKAFSHVAMLAQNHQETLTFAGEHAPDLLGGYLSASPVLANSHFFVAVCSKRPITIPAFMYVASGGNLLKDRETYINLLKQEVSSLTSELKQLQTEQTGILRRLEDVRIDLEKTHNDLEKARADFEKVSADICILQSERAMAAQSKWLRLGRKLGFGPKLQSNT